MKFSSLLAMMLVFAAPSFAEPAPTANVPEQCGGTDMIAELAKTDPQAHNKIIDGAAKIENGEALLWKIEKPGVAPSYLFGTIHMADVRVTTLPEKVQQALASSKTVAVEIAGMSDESMAAAMAKVPALLAYTDGTTLAPQLTADEFAKVQALVKKTGMPVETAAVLRPWLISTLLVMSDCSRQQLEAGKQALDARIEAIANAQGAKVVGLETAEGQLAAMASIPNDKQILMLKAGLAYAERTDDLLETLIQLYRTRKIAATMPFQYVLAEKVGIAPSAYDEFVKVLLVERNARMRDTSLPLLNGGATFIAVGSLHLPGETGLVALLRNAGYQVTPAE